METEAQTEKMFEFEWRNKSEEPPYIFHSRETGVTAEKAWSNLLTNDDGILISTKEITPKMLEAERLAILASENKVIERYVAKMKRVAQMDSHPAVAAHFGFIRTQLYGGESFEKKTHEDQFDEASGIPNHTDLVHYLAQLPSDRDYYVYDPESVWSKEEDPSPFEIYTRGVGLVVWFEREDAYENGGNFGGEYGRAWLVENPANGDRGLQFEYNGCEITGGIRVLVIPKT